MDEETNSWVRRVKFSHTVYHRLDSSSFPSVPLVRLSSAPSARLFNHESGLKSRPQSTVVYDKTSSHNGQILRNPITNKQRSVSPLPNVTLSDAFKEARSDQKRFSSPYYKKKEHEKGIIRKLFNKDSNNTRASDSLSSSSSSLRRNFSSMKIFEQAKSQKDSAWTKYFEYGGGKVTAVETADEWTIDLSKLYFGDHFACGAHSRLYHGYYEDERVAIKIMRPNDDEENGAMTARLEKQFRREVTLLSHLRHQNVIKLIGAYRKSRVFCIITEYLSGGSLRAFLHKLEHEHKSLPLQKLIQIAIEIAQGMAYIHSQGVIHRDLKPENILFDEDFCLKIADFGIACEEAVCDSLSEDPGTYRWMAPEVIKHIPYGRKVDVYSFGLILWEMVAGKLPYGDMTPIQAAFAVVNKNLRPVIPADCPPVLQILIKQCWDLHHETRPEFRQIIKVLEQFKSSLSE